MKRKQPRESLLKSINRKGSRTGSREPFWVGAQQGQQKTAPAFPEPAWQAQSLLCQSLAFPQTDRSRRRGQETRVPQGRHADLAVCRLPGSGKKRFPEKSWMQPLPCICVVPDTPCRKLSTNCTDIPPPDSTGRTGMNG